MLLLKGCDSSLVSKFRAHLFHVVFQCLQCMHLMPVCVHVYVCKTHPWLIQLVLNSCAANCFSLQVKMSTFGQFMFMFQFASSVYCYHFGDARIHLWTIPHFPLCCSWLRWCLLPSLFGHAYVCILSAFSLGPVHIATKLGNSARWPLLPGNRKPSRGWSRMSATVFSLRETTCASYSATFN